MIWNFILMVNEEKGYNEKLNSDEIKKIIEMTESGKFTRADIARELKRGYVTIWRYQKKYLKSK